MYGCFLPSRFARFLSIWCIGWPASSHRVLPRDDTQTRGLAPMDCSVARYYCFYFSACLLLFRAVVFHPDLSALVRFCLLMRERRRVPRGQHLSTHARARAGRSENRPGARSSVQENGKTNDNYFFGRLSDLCRWRRLVQQLHLHLFVDIVVKRAARSRRRLNLLDSRVGPRNRERERGRRTSALPCCRAMLLRIQ